MLQSEIFNTIKKLSQFLGSANFKEKYFVQVFFDYVIYYWFYRAANGVIKGK